MKSADTSTTAIPAKSSSPFFSKSGKGGGLDQFDSRHTFFPKLPNALQTKLNIGRSNDLYEKEADSVADKVVQRFGQIKNISLNETIAEKKRVEPPITPLIQSKCKSCEQVENQKKKKYNEESGEDGNIQMKTAFESNSESQEDEDKIQRKCDECDDENSLQKKETFTSGQSPSNDIEDSLSSMKGSGSALPIGTRKEMESSFNANFSSVRIHDDRSAVQMSKDLNAQAFTHGNDIYFNSGKYDTKSKSGKHLLAHELTHVIQQGSNKGSLSWNSVQRDDQPPKDGAVETELRKSGIQLEDEDQKNLIHDNPDGISLHQQELFVLLYNNSSSSITRVPGFRVQPTGKVVGPVEVYIFQVGKGRAIMVSSRGNESIMLDAGSGGSVRSGSQQARRLATFVNDVMQAGLANPPQQIKISHVDADHYNALMSVLNLTQLQGATVELTKQQLTQAISQGTWRTMNVQLAPGQKIAQINVRGSNGLNVSKAIIGNMEVIEYRSVSAQGNLTVQGAKTFNKNSTSPVTVVRDLVSNATYVFTADGQGRLLNQVIDMVGEEAFKNIIGGGSRNLSTVEYPHHGGQVEAGADASGMIRFIRLQFEASDGKIDFFAQTSQNFSNKPSSSLNYLNAVGIDIERIQDNPGGATQVRKQSGSGPQRITINPDFSTQIQNIAKNGGSRVTSAYLMRHRILNLIEQIEPMRQVLEFLPEEGKTLSTALQTSGSQVQQMHTNLDNSLNRFWSELENASRNTGLRGTSPVTPPTVQTELGNLENTLQGINPEHLENSISEIITGMNIQSRLFYNLSSMTEALRLGQAERFNTLKVEQTQLLSQARASVGTGVYEEHVRSAWFSVREVWTARVLKTVSQRLGNFEAQRRMMTEYRSVLGESVARQIQLNELMHKAYEGTLPRAIDPATGQPRSLPMGTRGGALFLAALEVIRIGLELAQMYKEGAEAAEASQAIAKIQGFREVAWWNNYGISPAIKLVKRHWFSGNYNVVPTGNLDPYKIIRNEVKEGVPEYDRVVVSDISEGDIKTIIGQFNIQLLTMQDWINLMGHPDNNDRVTVSSSNIWFVRESGNWRIKLWSDEDCEYRLYSKSSIQKPLTDLFANLQKNQTTELNDRASQKSVEIKTIKNSALVFGTDRIAYVYNSFGNVEEIDFDKFIPSLIELGTNFRMGREMKLVKAANPETYNRLSKYYWSYEAGTYAGGNCLSCVAYSTEPNHEGKAMVDPAHLQTLLTSSSIKKKAESGKSNDPLEKQADLTADSVIQQIPAYSLGATLLNNTNNSFVQRKEAGAPVDSNKISTDSSKNIVPGDSARFVVDDTAMTVFGQMRKTAFLSKLKEEICITVNQALEGTRFSSDKCPYIKTAFKRHERSNPLQLEQLIQRYEPSTKKALNANDLIRLMKIRVYAAAKHWANTGGDLSSLTKVFGGPSTDMGSIMSGMALRAKSLFFKAETGGVRISSSPQAIMQSLGKGNSIQAETKRKMESSFGTSFSDVEVHTDEKAAKLSREMNARAFTVGSHVAFANGEHRPGTMMGDALIAHELAHVEQQRNGKGNNNYDGFSQNLENEADFIAGKNILSQTSENGKTKRIRPELRTGLSLQRCSSDGPEYESLDSQRKQDVEEYMYRDVLVTDDETDQMPASMEMKWAGDPFLLTFSHTSKDKQDPGQLSVKVDFIGKHKPKSPASLMDNSKVYTIGLSRKGALNIFIEQNDLDTLVIWPYGKAPRNVRFEFAHEGPRFIDYGDSLGRIHHFTYRNRSSYGYYSGPFYIADKDAKAKDYPEAPVEFYNDKKEILGSEPTIYLISKGREIRLDADADYYKELVLRWSNEDKGLEYKFTANAFYIPTDPKGTMPKTFEFTAKKDLIGDSSAEKLVSVTDGSSDTVIGLGDLSNPKLLWSIQLPKINGGQIIYTYKISNGQTGEFSFSLPPGYKAPESQVEIPENGTKSTNRIWGQDVLFGPYRDPFRITLGIKDEKAKEAFFNIRSAGGGSIEGAGNIKIPITAVNEANAFSPQVIGSNGLALDLTVDANKTIQLHIFDRIVQQENITGTDDARKHRLRGKGNTLPEDFFYDFSIENHQFLSDGRLSQPYSGSQVANRDESFGMDAQTLSLDVLIETKTFSGKIAEYERELIFVRRKAHEEGIITDEVFQAWANMNGLALLYEIDASAANKKNLLVALEKYVTTYTKTDPLTVTAFKLSLDAGNSELVKVNYFNLLKPMDQEIVAKLSSSQKEVTKDLGLKASYLLDSAGKMNEIRNFTPLRIPATFAIKELYMANKEQYGHSLELYAYKDGDRLHLKNLTNRKEVGHVETGIPAESDKKSIAQLLVETRLINQLDDPDNFPEGLLYYRIPGYTSSYIKTSGGMSATSYAKLIGGAIAITGLVLLAVASLGTLSPEAAAGIAAVGGWMMLIGDATVLGASVVDIIADRYQKGHFDTKRVLINVFDAATSLLSAGTLTLGKVAVSGARVARTGAEISDLAKFAGKWYTRVQLAQGVAGAMGVILVAEDAIQKIKVIAKMQPGEGRDEAAISLFWHLLSIGAIAVLGLAGSKQFVPTKTDLLILSYAKAAGTTVPVAFMGGIARFTRANLGEFTDESAALRFIENNLTDESKAWFNARYGGETPASRLSRLEGMESAWEKHGLDLNGALVASAAKTNLRAAGIIVPSDPVLANRYTQMTHLPFINWTTSLVNMAAAGLNEAERTFLMNMLEGSGFAHGKPLDAIEIAALIAIRQGLRNAYQLDTTGNLAANIQALAPEFTTLGGALEQSMIDRFKIRLSSFFIQDKVLYGRTKALPPAGANPAGEAQRTIVGAHSGKILSDPRYEFIDAAGNRIADPLKDITPNSDGTYSVNFRKNIDYPNPANPIFQGRKNNPKGSTLAPLTWIDADILHAGESVAEFGVTDVGAGGGTVFKYGNYKGVNWNVTMEGGALTSSFPIGPNPVLPAGIKKIPKVP